MVYWTAINQGKPSDPNRMNETYREKYGFKELHIHNAPPRRNQDFKPTLYGDFIGMLNFKLSEPWALLRHIDDLYHEEHQAPIRWTKAALKGAFVGYMLGAHAFLYHQCNEYLIKKLYMTHNKGPFSLRGLKTHFGLMKKPMALGAALFFSYEFLWDQFTHHKEALNTPDLFTHAKIWFVLTPIVTTYFLGPGKIVHGWAIAMPILLPTFYASK